MAVSARALIEQLRLAPLDFGLLAALRRHCEDTRDFASWAEALELHAAAAAELGGDALERGRLHYELGNLYRNQLDAPDRALAHYQAAMELDAAQRGAIVAARELLTATGAWVEVAELWAREAELSPAGPKRAAALLELSGVYEHRLGDRTRAALTLLEAVEAGADDLHVQHRLATLLLEQADLEPEPDEARRLRGHAADTLCRMARAVDDDYALAYVESALDAVPEHADALALLEQLAARMQRTEALAPRWLAAIRVGSDARLTRGLRLKLARAYLDVGQADDARICLEPLLAQADAEAMALAPKLRAAEQLHPVDPERVTATLAEELASLADTELARAGDRPLSDLSRASEAPRDRTGTPPERGRERTSSLVPPAPRLATEHPLASAPADDTAIASTRARRDRTTAPEQRESEPGGEETQPRAAPLTIAELSALGGAEQLNLARTSRGRSEPEADHPDAEELARLRAELQKRVRFRDRRGAAEVAEALLERGAFDPGAVEALEEHYRLGRDFKRLRDLALRLGRTASFSTEVRSTRLREAVMLSETKLGDQEGAATALEELLAVEPADRDAFHKLKRLRTRAEQWDELATLLERRAAEETERSGRAEILRELGALERDKRGEPVRAIAAYAAARAFDPGRDEDDVALSELYLDAGRYAEAAATFEARLARARPFESPALLAKLAMLYEAHLGDLARAQRCLEAWREIEPHKSEVLEALIRVLEQRGEHRGLVRALSEKLSVVPAAERPKLHARIAELWLSELGDPSRAADAYAEAIARAPQERALWAAAAGAFEQAGRIEQLDGILWDLSLGNRDRVLAGALLAYLAETREARGDLEGAIAAREGQFAASQERGVLEALVALLRRTQRPVELSRRLDELARRSEPEDARKLRLERARLLADALRDPEAAKAELERILSELAQEDVAALRMLAELCTATGDLARRAAAQERLMKLAPSLPARVELARELVDSYEHELGDSKGAIRVLGAWSGLEPHNPQPLLRLVPLLTQAGQKQELLGALDKLASLAVTSEEAGEFVLRAAEVAVELGDHDGAWSRLVPRVAEAGDATAEAHLRDLAKKTGRGDQLAALFVGLAQRAKQPALARRRWVDAAEIYEQLAAAPDRALEAMLRALAKDLGSAELLTEVERLVERAGAWPRLANVYDTLVRRTTDTAEQKRLLMRHAQLLEVRGASPEAAFDRAWLAFQLDPADDHVYAETTRLAAATSRTDELLACHERRAQAQVGPHGRTEALLDCCALAYAERDERARALGYVSRAIAEAGGSTPLLERIEASLRALEAKHPDVTGRGLLAETADIYRRLATENGRGAGLSAQWLMRAARLYEVALGDHDAAYRALEQAATMSPGDEKLLAELTRAAAVAGAWEALASHLARSANAAIDSHSASLALARLGAICERELSSPARAADAYEQLVRLRPQDVDSARRLRACLRAAHRFPELLIAIDRELLLLSTSTDRLELLKQAAEAWEVGLKNRYEALDAWKKVAALAPDDADALAALARLRARPRTDDVLLLDGDLVVRPEDLRPSVEDGESEADRDASEEPNRSALDPADATAEPLREPTLLVAAGSGALAAGEPAIEVAGTLEQLSSLVQDGSAITRPRARIATPPPPPPAVGRRDGAA